MIRIDPANNAVIVGPKEALARNVIHIEHCNWLENVPENGLAVNLKFRSVMKPVDGKVIGGANGAAEIHLNDAQYGISPGQAAVCYTGDRVLGGGWIKSTDTLSQSA